MVKKGIAISILATFLLFYIGNHPGIVDLFLNKNFPDLSFLGFIAIFLVFVFILRVVGANKIYKHAKEHDPKNAVAEAGGAVFTGPYNYWRRIAVREEETEMRVAGKETKKINKKTVGIFFSVLEIFTISVALFGVLNMSDLSGTSIIIFLIILAISGVFVAPVLWGVWRGNLDPNNIVIVPGSCKRLIQIVLLVFIGAAIIVEIYATFFLNR